MPDYDVLLIHPPAVYDFRTRPLFPGVMGATATQSQFTKVPIGMLSIADYLDRHGYKTLIDNLGDRMAHSQTFNVPEHLHNIQAKLYAIGLHFQQHSQGAIEIARLCKKLHPDSLVILGGLTATRFHEEIIRRYPFIDAVVRGEAEKALLELMRVLDKGDPLIKAPNLTCRTEDGETVIMPLLPPSLNLDEFEYTRFDLLEPKTSIFSEEALPRWSLVVCRGCVYNCSICGGSAYSYKTYLGMEKPAFRSPANIIHDIRQLNSQGIRIIGLYQDPRMGGQSYWKELLLALRTEKLDIERLSIDLLGPADEEFIQAVAATGRPVTVHICPDTGCDSVRRLLGRHYSNEDLLQTVRLCHKYLIPVTSFFSVGLAGQTRENAAETWELSEKLSAAEQIMLTRSRSLGLGSGTPLGGPISGPVLLDPGSPAFDQPQRYGYKLLYPDLEKAIKGFSLPSWHQWLNYETELLSKEAITGLIFQSMAFAIEEREEYGFYDQSQAEAARLRLKADITAANEVDRLMKVQDMAERERGLREFKEKVERMVGQ
jgi:B12-binding domain/radical SAM domain protein